MFLCVQLKVVTLSPWYEVLCVATRKQERKRIVQQFVILFFFSEFSVEKLSFLHNRVIGLCGNVAIVSWLYLLSRPWNRLRLVGVDPDIGLFRLFRRILVV